MAFKPSATSIARLQTCHRDLRRIVELLWLDDVACQVLCGHRNKVDQEKAFMAGKSKLHFPYSKHNRFPAWAIDLAPAPIDWNDIKGFIALGELVKKKAEQLGISIRWGGDFKTWKDYPHYELVDVAAAERQSR